MILGVVGRRLLGWNLNDESHQWRGQGSEFSRKIKQQIQRSFYKNKLHIQASRGGSVGAYYPLKNVWGSYESGMWQ